MKSKLLKIVVATRNIGKLAEICEILGDLPIEFKSLRDFPDCPEASENYSTYHENAAEKARVVGQFCGQWVLADDSGLEVEALGGLPGVRSARFAGEGATAHDNNEKLLRELSKLGCENSPAAFHCVMVLRSSEGKEWVTEGLWQGRITSQLRGEHGFGYDPIFFLSDLNKTAAELLPVEKNQFSHRAKALTDMKKIIVELSQ